MASPFLKDFDGLLEEILRRYQNLDPAPDITQGSIVYIKAACLASMLWGLYKYQDYLADQIFLDTADTDSLNHWALGIFGIARLTDETDHDYAQRVMEYLQMPPAGGTAKDYRDWSLTGTPQGTPAVPFAVAETLTPSALNISTNIITTTQDWMDNARVQWTTTGTMPSGLTASTDYWTLRYDSSSIQMATPADSTVALALGTQGSGVHTITPMDATTMYSVVNAYVATPPAVPAGTVDITIVPNDMSIINMPAGETLRRAVVTNVESLRPVTASGTTVSMVQLSTIVIQIGMSPATVDLEQVEADIRSFMAGMAPGDTLYLSRLTAICVNNGATVIDVQLPTTDQVPYAGYMWDSVGSFVILSHI